jgi:hypothetical protein
VTSEYPKGRACADLPVSARMRGIRRFATHGKLLSR